MREDDNSIVGQKGIFPLHYADNSCKWKEHPDPDIDVLAFDATSLIMNFPRLVKKMVDYSTFSSPEKLLEYDIDIGDDILVIGYLSTSRI